MIEINNIEVMNFEGAFRGIRNPLESWSQSDSVLSYYELYNSNGSNKFLIGPKDLALAQKLIIAGSDHSKFMRQIFVSMDITAPRMWWAEMDTYKIGTVANSESTMHTIHKKPFELSDFSLDECNKNNNFIVDFNKSEPEIWKDIPDYENIYQISSWGRVKALSRQIIRKDGVVLNRQERFLNPSNDNNYLRVKLTVDGKSRSLRLHRILAEAFVENPDPENWSYVNHVDGNKLNNNINNLEWCSASQNVKHAWDNKINNNSNYRKFKNGYFRRKFSEEIMEEIKNLYKSGVSYSNLAERYNCGITTISRIINDKYEDKYLEVEDNSLDTIKIVVERLNILREKYLETNDKKYWREIIELLPQSYNQKRTWTADYQVLRNIYFARLNHKLTEWHDFCNMIEELPYGNALICVTKNDII